MVITRASCHISKSSNLSIFMFLNLKPSKNNEDVVVHNQNLTPLTLNRELTGLAISPRGENSPTPLTDLLCVPHQNRLVQSIR